MILLMLLLGDTTIQHKWRLFESDTRADYALTGKGRDLFKLLTPFAAIAWIG